MYANTNDSESLKRHIINSILGEMKHHINQTQLWMLENVVSNSLGNYHVEMEKFLPVIDDHANEKVMEAFLTTRSLEGLLENSINQYRYVIKKFFASVNMDYRDVNDSVMKNYLAQCSKTMKKITVNNIRRVLNLFYDWLVDQGYYSGKNPCRVIKNIKYEKRIKTPLTDLEIVKIRDGCENKREVALVDLLLSTGIRREEASNIMIKDIDFVTDRIKIFGKGAKERIVYLSTRCKQHLLEYLEDRPYESPYLFCNEKGQHNKISKEGICYIMRTIGKRIKVDKCQVHRIRKWFATDLSKKGCDLVYIQQMLGHESIETTKTYYVSVEQNMTQSEHSRYVA